MLTFKAKSPSRRSCPEEWFTVDGNPETDEPDTATKVCLTNEFQWETSYFEKNCDGITGVPCLFLQEEVATKFGTPKFDPTAYQFETYNENDPEVAENPELKGKKEKANPQFKHTRDKLNALVEQANANGTAAPRLTFMTLYSLMKDTIQIIPVGTKDAEDSGELNLRSMKTLLATLTDTERAEFFKDIAAAVDALFDGVNMETGEQRKEWKCNKVSVSTAGDGMARMHVRIASADTPAHYIFPEDFDLGPGKSVATSKPKYRKSGLIPHV